VVPASAAGVELEIPSGSAYVGVARLALASLARKAGLNEEAIDDLRIAVSEACTNAVLSNEQAGTDQPIGIDWREEDDHVIVEIHDRGAAFDPTSLDLSDTQGMRLSMSIALLKSLVDECEFSPRDDGGMSTRLVLSR
jgi:serine/threonine-protein kinase RsbW